MKPWERDWSEEQGGPDDEPDSPELKRILGESPAAPVQEMKPWQRDWKATEQKRRTPLEMYAREGARQLGLTARMGIEGVADIPLAITDVPTHVKRALGYPTGPTAAEALHRGLTAAGLPEPKNATERIVQDIGQTMTGTAGLAKGLTKGAVRLSELASAGASGGLAGGAEELGAPPWLGTLVGTLPLARVGGMGLKPPAPGKAAHEQIIQQAKDEGYVLPPTQTYAGKALTAVAGKGPTKAEATIRNQEVTNRIARREAGLQPDEPITDTNLQAARNRFVAPYREVAALDPQAADMWERLRQTRKDAQNQWRFYNSFGSQGYANPKVLKQAQLLDRRAERLETAIENFAIAKGKPDLVDRLRDARVKLAKNYQVDRAASPGGNVDPKVIEKQSRYGKTTGGLKTIADFEIERRPYFGVEMGLEPDVHMAGGIGLHHLGGWGYMGAGIPGVRGTARRAAMSEFVQRPEKQQGIPLSALSSYLAHQEAQ